MRRPGPALAGIAIALVAGCGPTAPTDGGDAQRARDAVSSPAAAHATAASLGDDITMRYDCEQGHRVAILDGGIARVTLADGRSVDIARVAGSAPPRFAGKALSFDIGTRDAVLGQDETGGFACREPG